MLFLGEGEKEGGRGDEDDDHRTAPTYKTKNREEEEGWVGVQETSHTTALIFTHKKKFNKKTGFNKKFSLSIVQSDNSRKLSRDCCLTVTTVVIIKGTQHRDN